MANGAVPLPPKAYYDFYKTSGSNTTFHTVGPSMTRQEFADECDINNIMKRYETTGFLPPNEGNVPAYVDWTAVPGDLMTHMEVMAGAERAFMQLPARVRREFDNNAYAFVEYASDPSSLEQMRAWGLAPPAEVPKAEPVAAPPTAQPAPEPAKPA